MTPERAQYILDNTVYGEFKYAFRRKCIHTGSVIHLDGITEQEDREIRTLWNSMPGHTCYHDAVGRIARGEGTIPDFTPEQKAKLGIRYTY